jgi:hypothetical protein
MSGTRWNTAVRALAAGALCVALAACGPSVSGSSSLQSVGAPATDSAQPSTTTSAAPATTSSAAPVAAVASLALTVTPDPTGTTVLAAVNSATGAAADGSVSFAVDGAPLGSSPVTAGQASITIPAGLPIGDHTATADFVPANPALVTAATGSATFTVAKAASSIAASAGQESIRYGDQETFDVSVQAPTAPAGTDLTGHVAILDGEQVIAEGDTDAAGHAALSVYNRADPGSKTYRASYSGNAAVDASTAEFVVQTTQTNVDISITWTDDLLPGSDATIWVDIVGTPDSPTGAVTLTYDGNQIANGAVDENGKISGTVTAVTAGDHAIGVSYAGDVRFEPNTGGATLTVNEPVVNPNAAGAAAAQASNPCPASASACIDLSNDQAWLQSGGQITYGPVPITSGMAGHRTPAGTFSVFWRHKNHKSSLFNDAPMPNSVFFNGGIAFHQGSLYDQSHGCIHLSWDASETFFDTLAVGDTVYAWGAAPY